MRLGDTLHVHWLSCLLKHITIVPVLAMKVYGILEVYHTKS